MIFDFFSDVHLTHNNNNIDWSKKTSDTLVIAGDTSNDIEIGDFLKEAKQEYNTVMFIDGNHEHYSRKNTVETNMALLKMIADQEGVVYLDGTNSVTIDDTTFIGVNGWYDFRANEPNLSREDSIKAWWNYMNDQYILFGEYTYPHHLADHQTQLLVKTLEDVYDNSKNIVVVTHASPRREFVGIGPHAGSALNGAYANITLYEEITKADVDNKIKCWVFGHTHYRLDKAIDGIRFLNNSRGYSSEARDLGPWSIQSADTNDNRGF